MKNTLGQVDFVRLLKVTALNLHVIMMKPEIKLWSYLSWDIIFDVAMESYCMKTIMIHLVDKTRCKSLQ